MQEISIHGNSQEWFTSKEAADHLKISPQSFNRLFYRYYDRLGVNAMKEKHRGGKDGHRNLINRNGIVLLSTLKDSDRKYINKEVVTPISNMNSREYKVQIAETYLGATCSIEELAEQTKENVETIRRWIDRHPEFKEKYCSNPFGVQLRILKEGIANYITLKGVGLKSSDKLSDAKSSISQIATLATTPSNDPIMANLQQMMAIRQEQLNQGQRLDNLENKIEEVKRLAIEVPPETMTNPEREYLNERVRYYAHQTEVPHWRIWGKLHSLVGRPEIGRYRSQDYKLAMKYLRTWYKEAEIEWN